MEKNIPQIMDLTPVLLDRVSQSQTKSKNENSLTTFQKVRAGVMATALLSGLGSVAHLAGFDEFLDPTFPLATDAELNQGNYPRFEDTEYPDRNAMMEVLSERINVKMVCTITTSSYGQVHVFADRPFYLSQGVEEIETGNNDTVLPTCIRLIQERFSNGRARSVTFEMPIDNAWHGSSSAPSVGPFERNDENGNGVNYESTPYTLGNKWHDAAAIERLEEAQQEIFSTKEKLRNRDSTLENLLDYAWQSAKDTAYSAIGWETMADQIQNQIWNRFTGGSDEAHPS